MDIKVMHLDADNLPESLEELFKKVAEAEDARYTTDNDTSITLDEHASLCQCLRENLNSDMLLWEHELVDALMHSALYMDFRPYGTSTRIESPCRRFETRLNDFMRPRMNNAARNPMAPQMPENKAASEIVAKYQDNIDCIRRYYGVLDLLFSNRPAGDIKDLVRSMTLMGEAFAALNVGGMVGVDNDQAGFCLAMDVFMAIHPTQCGMLSEEDLFAQMREELSN